ncbi:phosphatidate cytidylyltransferase [Aridibaculum aurantiacum]|uniref:phosphatidate cytidylyltransferase n=1 Tax=Aridibaculum aurantiacum TaxID=2810307 RepID=UPI001A9641AD|nr:phosphatidate cytidylyltransferase [Aridibaculum aurantiacum]
MAFNLQTFKTRALTAIVFVVVMLLGLLWNHWSFLILFLIIHVGCWIEYQKLIAKIDTSYNDISSFHKYSSILAGVALMLWVTNASFHFATVTLHEIGFWLLLVLAFVLPIIEVLFSRNINAKHIGYSFLGLLYISLSWSLMMDLRQDNMQLSGSTIVEDKGWILPMFLLASIWINDTMAYLVGSFIGKTSLSPISPKKTWEGTIGGAILCIGVVWLVAHQWLPEMEYQLVTVAAIAAVIGTIGDLVESKMKRMAGVKDSGHIMPGHGGFLDRFDSLLLATPFVWLALRMLF